jgi:chromosome segregation ATPase
LVKYRELRQKLGPFEYISRAMLAKAYGSNSTGTASKFMGVIEDLVGDQPPRRRAPEKPQENVSSPHPASVQSAFDGLRTALDCLSAIVSDARTKESLELAERYQGLLREQQTAADARHDADQERIADLEQASSGAGEESWKDNEAAENLCAELQAAEAERDAQKARADQAAHAHELDRARLTAAEAQIDAQKTGAALEAAEVSRLLEERKGLEEAAARGAELQTENARLSDRVNALIGQVARQDLFILDVNGCHEAERAAIRAEL